MSAFNKYICNFLQRKYKFFFLLLYSEGRENTSFTKKKKKQFAYSKVTEKDKSSFRIS